MSADNEREPFILFELADAYYAVQSRDIQQLEMVGPVTPVPNAPDFVDGVVSVRGQVIPVINLRARFGFARKSPDLRSRLIIVRSEHRTVGLLVDSAREFAAISAAMIQPPPEGIAGLSGRYLKGTAHVDDRLVLVLNVKEILEADSDVPQAASLSAES